MKTRRTIEKDKVVFFILLMLIATLNILWLTHKIKIRKWENQVEDPNMAEDYKNE